jgi:hypothetical protein
MRFKIIIARLIGCAATGNRNLLGFTDHAKLHWAAALIWARPAGLTLGMINGSLVGLAQPRSRFDQGIEHGLKIESRATYDLKHVGVEVCCCSDSRSSLSRRVFSMAMMAWLAKLVTSAICLSVNGLTALRISTKAPMARLAAAAVHLTVFCNRRSSALPASRTQDPPRHLGCAQRACSRSARGLRIRRTRFLALAGLLGIVEEDRTAFGNRRPIRNWSRVLNNHELQKGTASA